MRTQMIQSTGTTMVWHAESECMPPGNCPRVNIAKKHTHTHARRRAKRHAQHKVKCGGIQYVTAIACAEHDTCEAASIRALETRGKFNPQSFRQYQPTGRLDGWST